MIRQAEEPNTSNDPLSDLRGEYLIHQSRLRALQSTTTNLEKEILQLRFDSIVVRFAMRDETKCLYSLGGAIKEIVSSEGRIPSSFDQLQGYLRNDFFSRFDTNRFEFLEAADQLRGAVPLDQILVMVEKVADPDFEIRKVFADGHVTFEKDPAYLNARKNLGF